MQVVCSKAKYNTICNGCPHGKNHEENSDCLKNLYCSFAGSSVCCRKVMLTTTKKETEIPND